MRDKIRMALAVAAVAAALVAVFASRPSSDTGDRIAEVLVGAEVDNSRAEGAPQQQVVNGWVARDLLAVQAGQIDETNKALWGISWLLALTVALLGWMTFTSHRDRDRSPAVDEPVPPVPASPVAEEPTAD